MGLYYPVANILANCHTILYGSQTSDYFDVPRPGLEDYLNGVILGAIVLPPRRDRRRRP